MKPLVSLCTPSLTGQARSRQAEGSRLQTGLDRLLRFPSTDPKVVPCVAHCCLWDSEPVTAVDPCAVSHLESGVVGGDGACWLSCSVLLWARGGSPEREIVVGCSDTSQSSQVMPQLSLRPCPHIPLLSVVGQAKLKPLSWPPRTGCTKAARAPHGKPGRGVPVL